MGLLATARAIQTQLSEYSPSGSQSPTEGNPPSGLSHLNTDTKKPEELAQLLQEAALALLRTEENWTHVSAQGKRI